jgi:hypothetical protein
MHSSVIFHGTEREGLELAQIATRHCTCASTNHTGGSCPVHQMLASDQRAIDGLVFVRRTRHRYVYAEHSPAGWRAAIQPATRTRPRATC